MLAPAMRAIRGLHTPQAITTYSASTRPLSVTTAVTRPRSVSMPRISVLAMVCSAPRPVALSRKIVPARSESTADTVGK